MKYDEKNNTNKVHKKNTVYKVLFALFAVALAVILVLMVRNYLTERKAESAYDDLRETVNEETADSSTADLSDSPVTSASTEDSAAVTETPQEEEPQRDVLAELGITVPDKQLDWDALKAQNSDIYAWIYVPGTNVDYPIVQRADDNSYYVSHNLDGSEGYPGTIFTQNYNKTDFTDLATVVYGHNMKDLSMFHTLHSFEDADFFASNPYIYIYMPDGTVYVYEIFAACVFSDVHLFAQYTFQAETDLDTYLNDILNVRTMGANYRDGLTVSGKNHIIVLSTCEGTGETQRYLVNGVLLNDPAVPADDILAMFS